MTFQNCLIEVTTWVALTVVITFVVNVTSNDRKMRKIFMGCLDVRGKITAVE